LTSYSAVGAHPITIDNKRICDLTHTSVNSGNIGYNDGRPTQTDNGFNTMLYSLTASGNASFHNHMNKSMNTVYFMNNAPDYSKLMVFGDANLTDI
jgi:hypothetical protein